MKEEEKILITQAQLKSERGWTGKLISKYYPTPHSTKPNSQYRKAAPIKLFLLTKVVEIEADNNFLVDKGKAVKRQKVQADVVKKKKESLLDEISKLIIDVPKYEKDELFKLGLKHYEDLRYSRNEWDKIAYELYNDEGFIQSKAVNFLWFNCTGYVNYIEELHGKVGNIEARVLLLEIIFNAIKKQYPYLSSKCEEKCKFKIEEIKTWESYFSKSSSLDSTESDDLQFGDELDYRFTFNKYFTPEKDSKISYQPNPTITKTRWHGAIISSLRKVLEHNGFSVANNQNCDLYVFDSEKVIAVFEAKTRVNFQNLSTAIGQLVLYTSSFIYPCRQFIVLPQLPSNAILTKLKSLQIEVITFRRVASEIFISNLEFIEQLKSDSDNAKM